MLSRVLVLLVPLCYCAVLNVNWEEHPGEAAHELFLTIDANNDTWVTLVEMVEYFNLFDTNHDKRVAKREYTDYINQHHPYMSSFAPHIFDALDHDGDGRLELPDFVHLFNTMDPSGAEQLSVYTFVGYMGNESERVSSQPGTQVSPSAVAGASPSDS